VLQRMEVIFASGSPDEMYYSEILEAAKGATQTGVVATATDVIASKPMLAHEQDKLLKRSGGCVVENTQGIEMPKGARRMGSPRLKLRFKFKKTFLKVRPEKYALLKIQPDYRLDGPGMALALAPEAHRAFGSFPRNPRPSENFYASIQFPKDICARHERDLARE